MVSLDQLVVQGNQDKQDPQDLLVSKVQEEIKERLGQQDQLDQLVHLVQLDLGERQDQMELWVPKDLQDHLVQPDNEEMWVHRDQLVKLDRLDHLEIQAHLDRVERLETKEQRESWDRLDQPALEDRMDLPDNRDNLVLWALMDHQGMWDLGEMLVLGDRPESAVTQVLPVQMASQDCVEMLVLLDLQGLKVALVQGVILAP